MKISYRVLRYFAAAAELSSISKAGEKLHISPSAVSAAIDILEEEFRLKLLLRRRAKGLQLTATGKLVLGRVKHLLEDFETFVHEGAELSQSVSGSMNIGYSAPIAPAFIPMIVKPVLKGHPSVTMRFTECDTEEAQKGLLSGDFDVILFVAYGPNQEIHYETMLDIPPYVVVSKRHRLARKQRVLLNELAGEPLVLLDFPTTRDYYRSLLDDAGIEANVILKVTTTEMVRSLVAMDLGCSILNMRPAIPTTYAGPQVVCLPLENDHPPLQLVLGHLHENPRRLVRLFTDQCRLFFTSPDALRNIVIATRR